MRKNRNDRRLCAPGLVRDGKIEADLKRASQLSLAELRTVWRERIAGDPPPIRSRDVLLRLYAWRVQAHAYGGLNAKTQKRLEAIASALECGGAYKPNVQRSLSPGVILTREWKGVVHKATITADGYQYLGRTYGSLSDVARTITGTRWSGPRFFGLEQRRRLKREAAE